MYGKFLNSRMISNIDIVIELAAKLAVTTPTNTGIAIFNYPVISKMIIATDTDLVTAPERATPPTIA